MGFLIDMINVGEGDSFLLTLDDSNGGEAFVLIDGGLPSEGDTVIQFLEKYAPDGLNLVIATHIDNDHIGGLTKVVQQVPIQEFVINVPPAFTEQWFGFRQKLGEFRSNPKAKRLTEAIDLVQGILDVLRRRKAKVTTALQGRSWSCGDVQLTVLNPTADRLKAAWQEAGLLKEIKARSIKEIMQRRAIMGSLSGPATRLPRPPLNPFAAVIGSHPPPVIQQNLLSSLLGKPIPPRNPLLEAARARFAATDTPNTSPENDASIVIEIAYRDEPYGLMTSDAGAAVLKEVTQGRKYPFLKVPHHGSKTGLDENLVKQLQPRVAFIPVGDNEHGHPALEVLELLRSNGVRTLCSTKTKDCRKDCRLSGFGDVCHRVEKNWHQGYTEIDLSKCTNNSQGGRN